MSWLADNLIQFAAMMVVADEEIEELWHQFEDVPMNPVTEEIQEDFMHFPRGTSREEILHWFDEHHSLGVHYLLYGGDRE